MEATLLWRDGHDRGRWPRRLGARSGPQVLEVVLTGDVDARCGGQVAVLLVELLAARPSPVVLDASGVTAVDVAGLGALLVLVVRLDSAGHPVHLRRPSTPLVQLVDRAESALTLLEGGAGTALRSASSPLVLQRTALYRRAALLVGGGPPAAGALPA